jgi:hypothetical protein
LKLFSNGQSEDKLHEIRSLLTAYLSARVTPEAENAFNKKGYSSAVFKKNENKNITGKTPYH